MSIELHEHRERPATCPFCRAAVRRGEATWECPRCATLHHQECAKENHRCTVLGCEGRFSTAEVAARATAADTTPAPPRRRRSWLRRHTAWNGFFLPLSVFVGLVSYFGVERTQPRSTYDWTQSEEYSRQRRQELATKAEREAIRLLRSVARHDVYRGSSRWAAASGDAEFNQALFEYEIARGVCRSEEERLELREASGAVSSRGKQAAARSIPS